MSEDDSFLASGQKVQRSIKELVELDWRVARKLVDVLVARGQASAWQYRGLLAEIGGEHEPRRVALALIIELGNRGDLKVLWGLPDALSAKAARNRRMQWKLTDAANGCTEMDFDEALHRLRVWYGAIYSWVYRFGSEGAAEPIPNDTGPSVEVFDLAEFRSSRDVQSPAP